MRIERAKKRKVVVQAVPMAEEGAAAVPDLVVEEIPDPMEEVAAQAAVGHPGDRVEPLVRPDLESGPSQPVGLAGSVQQRLEQTEKGRMRIERAKKRKAVVQAVPMAAEGAAAVPDLVVEEISDPMEEVAAQAAVGHPGDRVEPLVRPDLESGPSQPVGLAASGAEEMERDGTRS